ncbi:hypothetical protein KCV07_g861, partial [Aureobasidium melanogenum]
MAPPKGYTWPTWTLRALLISMMDLPEDNEIWGRLTKNGRFNSQFDASIAMQGLIGTYVKPEVAAAAGESRTGGRSNKVDPTIKTATHPTFGTKPSASIGSGSPLSQLASASNTKPTVYSVPYSPPKEPAGSKASHNKTAKLQNSSAENSKSQDKPGSQVR